MAAATVGYARRPLLKWESWTLGILSLGLFVPFIWINLAVLVLSIWFFISKKDNTLLAVKTTGEVEV